MSLSPTRSLLCVLTLLLLSACARSDPATPIGPMVNIVPAPENRVGSWSAGLSPDGATLAARCVDAICLWDTATGEIRGTLPRGLDVAWSPDGTRLASTSNDASIFLVDPASGEILLRMEGHTIPEATDGILGVTSLAFSPDGALLASATHDGTVRLWSTADGRAERVIDTQSSRPTAVAFSPDGQRIAVASTDQPVQLWEVRSGRRVAVLRESPPQSYGIAFSPDGRWLATTSNDPEKKLYLWDASTLNRAATFPEEVVAHDVAFSPDSALLAFSDKADKSVRLWTIGGEEQRILVGHEATPHAVRFSPDGTKLYSLSDSEGVLQWDVATGELVRRFELP